MSQVEIMYVGNGKEKKEDGKNAYPVNEGI